MTAATKTTHVRAPKGAPRRISRLGKKLAAQRGGQWLAPQVVDEALNALEAKLDNQKTESAG